MRAGLLLCAIVLAGCASAAPTSDYAPQVAAPTETPTIAAPVPQGPCAFDARTLSFAGDLQAQARCLLRHVRRGGDVDGALAALPAPLDALIGHAVDVTPTQMRTYLAAKNIDEADLGGSLSDPLSTTASGATAAYFVIHDTSTPNLLTQDFPADINDPSWRYNDLTRWRQGEASVAHVFVSRAGNSTTAVDFSRAWRATKLEIRIVGAPSRGRFLHIENVQPRRSASPGPAGNDMLAPQPGFSDAQMHRLALIYIAASVRAGTWLIPCQHAVLDNGIEDGHDDPQNFDLNAWAAALARELAAIRAS